MDKKYYKILHICRIVTLILCNLLALSLGNLLLLILTETNLFNNFFTFILVARFYYDIEMQFWITFVSPYIALIYLALVLLIKFIMKGIYFNIKNNAKAGECYIEFHVKMNLQIKNIFIVYGAIFAGFTVFAMTYSLDPILNENTREYFLSLLGKPSGGAGGQVLKFAEP
jgi:hypothetical protein